MKTLSFHVTLLTSTCLTFLACEGGGGLTGGNEKKTERRILDKNQSEDVEENEGIKDLESGVSPEEKTPGKKTPLVPTPIKTPPPLPTNPQTEKDSQVAQTKVDFKGWCSKAGEVTPVASGRLRPLLVEFCDASGNPTELFTKNLIASAYVGTGDPVLTPIKPLASSGSTTSYRFGIAIKLPISLKDHFDKVGPKAGDVSEIKKLHESSGAGTTAVVTLLATHPASGQYHVQGFTTHSKVVKPVLITTVTSEAETRNDNFKFAEGEQILYTQYTSKAVQTVKYFDYIAAGISIEGSAYLIVLVDAALDNKGFAKPAEDQVKSLALLGIKQMYTLASQAK